MKSSRSDAPHGARKLPTRGELTAAYGRTIPDVIAKYLDVLFTGINPSLYSAVVGHHFARPGNRFWPALYQAGFTPELWSADRDQELVQQGYGITNLVPEATARADELSKARLIDGGVQLIRKVKNYQPRCVAFVGITAYRQAYSLPKAKIGLQPVGLAIDAGIEVPVWVLPNPSGLNAHYQLPDFARLFGELREALQGMTD